MDSGLEPICPKQQLSGVRFQNLVYSSKQLLLLSVPWHWPKLVMIGACLQAILLYTEGVLIAQYVFLIPTRLECNFLTEPVQVGSRH